VLYWQKNNIFLRLQKNDPTLNQFPADGTHLRLVRGGLEQQATILPLIGRLHMTVIDLELDPRSTPILVGQEQAPAPRLLTDLPRSSPAGACRCSDQ